MNPEHDTFDQNTGTPRIALGTVQFGLAYGVSNAMGQVSLDTAREVLNLAGRAGCDTLDTAMAYGDSEERLGRLGVAGWRIVTKLPAFPDGVENIASWSRGQLQGSLRRLGVAKVDTLLLHSPAQLRSSRGEELFNALRRLCDEGLVTRLGVSIYDPGELDELVPRFPIKVVQAPHNVLDRSLTTSGWAERLAAEGIEIHVRSVFLQGLLLMAPHRRHRSFAEWDPIWSLWAQWLRDSGLSPLQACMRDAMAQEWAGKVVVGVTSAGELSSVIKACNGSMPPLPSGLVCSDPRLVNPSRWKVQ